MRTRFFKHLAVRYHISRVFALRGYFCTQKRMSITFLARVESSATTVRGSGMGGMGVSGRC
jgi:hypothetical protein